MTTGSLGASMSAPDAPLRVLAWPAYKTRENNPYPWLLYTHLAGSDVIVDEYTPRRAVCGSYDVVHIHWPDYQVAAASRVTTLMRLLYFKAVITWCKWRGAQIVWTVHNLTSHEGIHPRLEASLWKTVTNDVGACLCLSRSGHAAVIAKFPLLRQRPIWVVRHGHYRGAYADQVSREAARARLGVEPHAAMILFFGSVRPYKNVASLISCFTQLSHQDAVLVIAGQPHSPLIRDQVRGLAAHDSRIRLELHHVPSPDVQYFLRAADLVVLPFAEIFNSGSALLALSFDCPVLLPRKGAMEDLRDTVGPDWVMMYDAELTGLVLEHALRRAIKLDRRQPPDLREYDWPDIARQTRNALQQLVARRAMPLETT